MCLLIFTEENKKPIKLTEDLTVYKVLSVNRPLLISEPGQHEILTAPHNRHFKYELNKLYETQFTFNESFKKADMVVHSYMMKNHPEISDIHINVFKYHNNIDEWKRDLIKVNLFSVCAGFHSILTMDRVKTYLNIYDDYHSMGLYKATIPKGATIYKDETGLVVSNRIIINERIKKP